MATARPAADTKAAKATLCEWYAWHTPCSGHDYAVCRWLWAGTLSLAVSGSACGLGRTWLRDAEGAKHDAEHGERDFR